LNDDARRREAGRCYGMISTTFSTSTGIPFKVAGA
jgi:hypothetical protein